MSHLLIRREVRLLWARYDARPTSVQDGRLREGMGGTHFATLASRTDFCERFLTSCTLCATEAKTSLNLHCYEACRSPTSTWMPLGRMPTCDSVAGCRSPPPRGRLK